MPTQPASMPSCTSGLHGVELGVRRGPVVAAQHAAAHGAVADEGGDVHRGRLGIEAGRGSRRSRPSAAAPRPGGTPGPSADATGHGAAPIPQLPTTHVVTPPCTLKPMSGWTTTAKSSWVWVSMNPGASTSPEPSPSRRSTAAMRSPSTRHVADEPRRARAVDDQHALDDEAVRHAQIAAGALATSSRNSSLVLKVFMRSMSSSRPGPALPLSPARPDSTRRSFHTRLQLVAGEEQLLVAGRRGVDVDGRVDAALGHACGRASAPCSRCP